MLKLTFSLKSNIRLKNSKTRLSQLQIRLYTFQLLYLNSLISLRDLELTTNSKFLFRKNRMVLMRSPFHYKVSKTLLAQPTQKTTISWTMKIPTSSNAQIYAHLTNAIGNFKNSSLFTINSIKVDIFNLC